MPHVHFPRCFFVESLQVFSETGWAAGLAVVAAGLLTRAGEGARDCTPHVPGGWGLRSSAHSHLSSPASGSVESTLGGFLLAAGIHTVWGLSASHMGCPELAGLVFCYGPRFCRPALGSLHFLLSGARQTNLFPSH